MKLTSPLRAYDWLLTALHVRFRNAIPLTLHNREDALLSVQGLVLFSQRGAHRVLFVPVAWLFRYPRSFCEDLRDTVGIKLLC